ncbi:MAG: membrane protein insertion efficiency factor YidD [Parvularculales bacterium]
MLGLIKVYQWGISPFLPPRCRYGPSCSAYAATAIMRHGVWRGGWLILARLCRCHPWGGSGFDPVPDVVQHQPFYAPWRYGEWRYGGNYKK